ncbi:uncharacterized protein A1O9_03565 [Exophiala aquamarina CBS 119918]|uniref:Uncharacterized protein n=1 Tax=Exophiala aquamarina CBS 119918 TaxID=1182545 RepID=A0A072PRN1_9EURO|nr:uncharacterized protein A1O9_03565 [Exophiala aquamarina CBS 119918]KEF61993.1 hypothetical protein A1O9_03565 [Exophiala aquamarina CBS 119918]
MLFWSNEVLRAAIHYPSVRHLVIALGAAYESFELGGSKVVKTVDSGAGMQFAMQQCNHAIRYMDDVFQYQVTVGQTIERTCCILTASILFTYLASLQGNLLQAIQHVRSGLKVLQDFERDDQFDGPRSPPYPVPLLRLRTLLISIYGQVRTMINDESLQKWHHDPLVSHLEPVSYFMSVDEAHGYVERLFHNLQAFLQASEQSPPRTSGELTAFISRRRQLRSALKDSCEALDLLAARQQPGNTGPESRGIVILRLYHILIDIRLEIDPLKPTKRESAFDNLQDRLEQILIFCEQLVKDDHTVYTRPSCSSGLGIVLPLHTVAARCRSPRHRRRALDLLLSIDRRECLWDSILTGRIATKTMEIEEHAHSMALAHKLEDQARELDDARVREVKIEFTEEKKVLLQYITVRDYRTGGSGTRHVIEW